MTLDWIPEKFPPSGGLAAEGFAKLLGRPKLDPLTVLVRETAQNSWDARDGSGRPVRFRIDGRTLSEDIRRVLHEEIFVGADRVAGTGLADALAGASLSGLYITDRNTKGLGGPVQANQVDPEKLYDWVDFVLNVGKANTQGHTGGTYGFGKTISYVVSQCSTILIHTRTLIQGAPVTRLMASAIGEQFTSDGTLCTGRHWWGRDAGGAPVPVEGTEANTIATRIGMPAFGENEYGTNILVLAPDFGDRTERQGMTFITESLLWHLWPKMIQHSGEPPMTFGISWNDEPIPVPSPADRPPLSAFVTAFSSILREEPGNSKALGLQHVPVTRSGKLIGDLVTLPFVATEQATVDDGYRADDQDSPRGASPFTDQTCHHTALLRTPELVVEYREGPLAPEAGVEWAGVFRVTDECDKVFAQAEPPTHDSWRPELLTGTNKLIVSKALRDIKNHVTGRWGAARPVPPSATTSTAVVADALAHLLGTVAGQGQGRPDNPGPGSSGTSHPAKSKVELLSSGPQLVNGVAATYAKLRLTPKKQANGTRLRVSVGIALDGSAMDTAIDSRLRLLSWETNGDSRTLDGREAVLLIEGDQQSEVLLLAQRSAANSVLWNIDVEDAETSGVTP